MQPSKLQVVKSIKKSLTAYEFDVALSKVTNEAQTRELLIEPVIDILGYNKLYHWITEAHADRVGRKGLKVDYALAPKGKDAVILIEAKDHKNPLGHKVFAQLSEYFTNVKSARIGILTNGLDWKFYAGDGSSDRLSDMPFFHFNVLDWTDGDIEGLARFHISLFKSVEVLQEAEEVYMLSKFDQALYEELRSPSDGFLTSIINRMDIGRATAQRKIFVRDSINYLSLKDAYDKLITTGALSPDDGIITTSDELQAFQTVKTLITGSSKSMAKHSEKITFRDRKNGKSSVLWMDSRNNPICHFHFTETKMELTVENKKHNLSSIDDIINFKAEIIEAAKQYVE
jgi:predicted type IV restriction endonuclease